MKKKKKLSPWFIVLVVFIIFFWRITVLHCWPDQRIVKQGQNQYWRSISVSTTRGTISDRNGEVLAISVPSMSFFVDPKFWNPAYKDKLSGYFSPDVLKKLTGNLEGRYILLAKKIPYEKGQEIAKLDVPGLYPFQEKKRVYVNGSLMSHVIGYCDIDDVGLSGTELIWDNVLYSPPETQIIVKDASGINLDISNVSTVKKSSTKGRVSLTLDSGLQFIVEKYLKEGIELHRARWGAVVCMDPHSGSILSMASIPAFDPNNRSTFLKEGVMRNNCIGRVYEPGSTLKPVIAGIALENGLVSPEERFKCTRKIKVGDKYISDPKAYGNLSLADVIIKSSNVGMSQIGIRLDPYKTYKAFINWGFEKPSGLELNGAETGLIPSPGSWLGVVPGNIAIGQGLAISPLQLLTAFSAIANGGSLVRPFIVRKAWNSQDEIVYEGKRNERYRVLSEKTASWLRGVMERVVTEGTGQRVNSEAVQIAGKTGTAQVAEGGEYQEDRWVSSFAGFWPADSPKFAMVVVIGEPSRGEYYGGSVAGPVFKNIVEDFTSYLKETI